MEKGFIHPKLKVCFKLHRQWRMRHALLHWVSQHKKQAVADYNERFFGPVNIQSWRARWEYKVLTDCVVNDTLDEYSAQLVLERGRAKQRLLMKKVLIRLELQTDPDLRILPIYFNQLKSYAKMRKLWKYVLKQLHI